MPRTATFQWIFPTLGPPFLYIPLLSIALLIHDWLIVWAYIKNHIPQSIYAIYLHGMIHNIWTRNIHNTDWTSELPSLVTYIVSAGHTPNSYTQFIHSIHRFKAYALLISLILPPVPYAQIIHPSHTLKSYPQTICLSHTLKSYTQAIRPNHTPKTIRLKPYAQNLLPQAKPCAQNHIPKTMRAKPYAQRPYAKCHTAKPIR